MEKDKQQSRQTRRNKVRVVSARFTDIEYQAVEKRRKDAGVSLSRFVHSVLLTGKVVQRISKADADVLRKLAGEANNINQLAHKANAGGFAGVAAELMMLKKKIVQIIKQLSDDWKISKGAGFRGCVNYVLGKPDAKLLAAEGVLTDSIQTITDCFQSQRMMKPHIRQPVGHISLSYAPEDASRMTDEILVSLAKEYMQKMGIKETQYIIARHKDQKHPHVHIVFNRVDNNRRTISDKNDCYRNVKVCKELKEKYGLYFGKGKDRVRTHRLKGNDKTKYEIYHAVKYSLSKSNNWKLFISELSRQGIKTEFKYRGKSNVIQGLSLTKDGITFKASGIDRNFSYSKLDKQLGENNNQYQQGIGMTTNNGQPVIQHENTYTSSSNIAESLVGALGGLFTPTFNNADENAEAAFQRKLKKRKRKE